MGYIYKITNNISKKCYIGETKKNNPYLRWNEHKRKIEQGIGCPALQDAVKKYGIDHITISKNINGKIKTGGGFIWKN